jgi:hypothetical protein
MLNAMVSDRSNASGFAGDNIRYGSCLLIVTSILRTVATLVTITTRNHSMYGTPHQCQPHVCRYCSGSVKCMCMCVCVCVYGIEMEGTYPHHMVRNAS